MKFQNFLKNIFKDLIGQIDSKITEISNKLDEIKKKEEEEAAAAAKKAEEEAAKKAQESSGNKTSKKSNKSNNSNNNASSSNNSSNNNNSSNDSNSGLKHHDSIPPLKINGVLFYAPQKVVNLFNSRTTSVWNSGSTTYNGVDACKWYVDDDYSCIADQNGNILVEY